MANSSDQLAFPICYSKDQGKNKTTEGKIKANDVQNGPAFLNTGTAPLEDVVVMVEDGPKTNVEAGPSFASVLPGIVVIGAELYQIVINKWM